MKRIILISLIIIGLFPEYSSAQCGTSTSVSLSFINPSFEGVSCPGCQPAPWTNCGGSPDTQPGQWGFTQPASNGNSYVSFLLSGFSAGGYFEGSSQALSACMTAGQVYNFSIDLAHSNVYLTAEPGDCYSSLEILGSNGLCTENEVLWQSGLITNTNWQTYNVTLTPTSNWCYVTFRPYWISTCNGYANIMVDNLGPLQTSSPTLNATVNATIACSQDIIGTTSCPSDSVILTGSFNGSPVHATMPTDTTWNANVTYPLGSPAPQKITVHAFLQTGVSLYDTISFNLLTVTADFSSTAVCIGNATSFTDNSISTSGSITAWTWNFGDGSPVDTTQNPTHTYTNPGTYNVSLLVNSSTGCLDTVSKAVQVYSNPTANFTYSTACLGDSIHFTNTSSINSSANASYLWVFGDGTASGSLQNPVHDYALAGNYNVTLVTTTTGGCSDTISLSITVSESPVSSFLSTSVCVGVDSTVFTNTSVNPTTGTIANWAWDFGDGTPLNTTAWSPHHLYSAPGNYLVTLITYSTSGCPDTMQATTTVLPKPLADFSSADVCLHQVMNFNDSSSTIANETIASWSWNFGDGNPLSAAQNPIHTYTGSGTFPVSLIITTANGCTDTISKNVTVHPLPVPQFYAENVCNGDSVQFNNLSSTIPPETIQSVTWDFGDTSPIDTTTWSPNHLYSNPGNYPVTLIAYSSAYGCPDTMQSTIIVFQKPLADFSYTDVCLYQGMNFNDSSSTITNETIVSWRWNFGDGSPVDTTQNPTHTYTSPGTYTSTLLVNSSTGCMDTVSKALHVYPNPTANFNHTSVCLGDSMYFNNTSSVDSGSFISGYLWVFGDGSASSSLLNPVHDYAVSGNYNVTLVTITADGCSNAISLPVSISGAPTSSFTFSSVCAGADSVVFTNTSVNPTGGTIANWSWNFGDGTPINITTWSPHHLYSTSGNYSVTLITSTSSGCVDTLQATITVLPKPLADFTYADVCLHQVMNFNDSSSTVPNETITSWSWNFGDGNPVSTAQNPPHTYTNAGTFPVSLTITTRNGCTDTISKNVTVHPLPIPQFTAENVCHGDSVLFNNLSGITPPGTIQSWVWIFGDGNLFSNNQNTSHLYTGTGPHTVKLIAVSGFGCVDSISKTVVVNPNPVVNFTSDDTLGCEPLCIHFQNSSSIAAGTNTQFVWNFGDGSVISATPTPQHCYSNDSVVAPIMYPVSLTVTSDSGCVGAITKNNFITVYPSPNADFNIQPATTTIADPLITATNLSSGANFWNWNFGDTATSSGFSPPAHTYADTGNYIVTLMVSNQYGCTDTTARTVIIEPDFIFYVPNAFTPDGDGINDTFTGKGVFIKELEMRIFDRWGNLIYKTIDIKQPWDGKAMEGNEIAQQDVYVYVINVTDSKGKNHNYRGTVTLVK